MATITGTSGDDYLVGTNQNDILIGGAGDDRIDGGGGSDVVVFSGIAANYQLGESDNALLVVDMYPENGDTGSDTLTAVEVLRFSDKDYQVVVGDSQANTTSDASQTDPAIASLADGGYIVSWTSGIRSSSELDIRAQIHGTDGFAQGSEFLVNTTSAGIQADSEVVALTDGGFLITWADYDPAHPESGRAIKGQRYDASGVPTGLEFRVDPATDWSGERPDVAALADGGFVVTWENNVDSSALSEIFMQRFDAGGVAHRLRFLEPMTAAILSGHRVVPTYGMAGGEPEKVGCNRVERVSGEVENLGGTAKTKVRSGDVFVIETPGGGGYCKPGTRKTNG